MQITIKGVPKIPAPTSREVCVLRGKVDGHEYLVYFVPGPHEQYLFVGGYNAYLSKASWESHVNEYYDHVGTFKQDVMEVTFNA